MSILCEILKNSCFSNLRFINLAGIHCESTVILCIANHISRETLSIFIHLLNQHFFHHLEFVNLNGMLNTQGQVLIL